MATRKAAKLLQGYIDWRIVRWSISKGSLLVVELERELVAHNEQEVRKWRSSMFRAKVSFGGTSKVIFRNYVHASKIAQIFRSSGRGASCVFELTGGASVEIIARTLGVIEW